MNNEFKVDHTSDEVKEMTPDWELVDALWGGTRAMRQCGTKFLPQRTMETDKDYQNRLKVATLFPAFSETVEGMAGRVFAEDLVHGDDIPDWIRSEVLEDCDLAGNNVDVFAMRWFTLALRRGHALVLVDSPRSNATVRTLSEQQAAGLRPYYVLIDPKRVLGWIVGANGNLEQIRIRFWREERHDFHTKMIEQIRVYEPGRCRIFEKNARQEWMETEQFPVAIKDVIPIVPFYTKGTGVMLSEPPLRELAYLNAKHWAQQSSNDSLIETASVPILALMGVDLGEGNEVIIGAKHALNLPIGAEVKYVEHTGAAIGAGRTALQDLKDEMRQAGAKLLMPLTAAAKTATEAGEDNARENSLLGRMSKGLDDALAQLLVMTRRWREASADEAGSLNTKPNLSPDPVPHETMKTVLEMRREELVSSQTAFEKGQELGFIPEDIKWEDEQARIATERPVVEDNDDQAAGPRREQGVPGAPGVQQGEAE